MSVFLSNYNKLESYDQLANVLDVIVDDVKPKYVEPNNPFIYKRESLIFDALELATSVRVKCYSKQIMKLCKIVDPKLDDNFISKTLYQIKIKNKDKFLEKIDGQFLVWSKIGKEYTSLKKPVEGTFSNGCDSNTHESKLVQKGNERVVFLDPLDKNAERQTKPYLAAKYHPETWVVTYKNKQNNVWLFNWQESSDHIRTYYARENGFKNDDIRCRRLKNYCKVNI